MSFEQFACFASDYDIFPRFCSKPALYRVFHTLALMKEVLQPNPVVRHTKKLLQQHSVSIMNPNSQTLTHGQYKDESIDKNLFIEAITLCALYQEKDKFLMQAVSSFDPERHEEPSPELMKLLLTYCLDMVDVMNSSERVCKNQVRENKFSKSGVMSNNCIGINKNKFTAQARDIMGPFR